MNAHKYIVATLLLANLTLLNPAFAFEMPKIPGVNMEVTAASLLADSTGGLDYFKKALTYYELALSPAKDAAETSASLKQSVENQGEESIAVRSKKVAEISAQRIAEGKALNEDQKKLIDAGAAEYKKGLVKWAVVAGALVIAAKNGAKDEALIAAIPVVAAMIKDLGTLKEMQTVIKKLNKLRSKT